LGKIHFKEYSVKSDLSLAKTMVNQVVIVHPNGTTTTRNQTEVVYDPTFGLNNGFPFP
jgi:hypothetical protein